MFVVCCLLFPCFRSVVFAGCCVVCLGCWMRVVVYCLFVMCCLFVVGCYVLFLRSSLFLVCCFVFVVFSVIDVCCFGALCLSFGVCCGLFLVRVLFVF